MQARVFGDPAPKQIASDRLTGEFAPAQYFELSIDQKISARSCEERKSGIQARTGPLVAFGETVARPFTYEDKLRDPDAAISSFLVKTRFFAEGDSAIALAGLSGSALGRSTVLRDRVNAQTPADAISIKPGGFKVVDAFTMQPVEGAASAATRIDADRLLEGTVLAQPGMAGRLVVVSALEVA